MAIQRAIDPITLEVIKNRLGNFADEAQIALLRSAYSTTVKEASDASCAIFDGRGETLAQAHLAGGAVHLGALAVMVKRLLEYFPVETLREGDILCTNDPYSGAHHLPDLIVVAPVMVNGKTIALTATMAHHQDVGDKVPGSTPSDSTDIFQEGLRIPPAKLYDGGVPNQTLFDIIEANVRTPEVVTGDIRAQLAACLTAKRRLLELIEEYGVDTVLDYTRELLDRAEAATRAKIAEIPNGTYEFEDYLDNDGIDLDRRMPVRVSVEVRDMELVVDFTGTSPQVRGPINSVPSVAIAATYYVVRVITDPNIPNNGGCYRPVQVKLPEDSLVNPRFPAPVAFRAITLRRIVDTLIGAMAQAVPDKVHAASNGHPLNMALGGKHPSTGKPWVTAELGTGGMGARPTKDGIDSIQTDTSNSANIPTEAVEMAYPLRITKFALRRDSGGAGKFRGGLGFEKEYQVLSGPVSVTHRGERHYVPPWGLFGGMSAACSRSVIQRQDGTEQVIPAKLTFTLEEGDRLLLWTSGGGGYGDPLTRPARAVLDDVLDGKVSVEVARRDYGVVISSETGEMDENETEALRTQMAGDRGPITWTYDRGDGAS